MAALGLTGMGIDPKYGGSGGGYRQMSIVEEEIARGRRVGQRMSGGPYIFGCDHPV